MSGLRRLSGGASRETFSFAAGERALILQRQRPGAARSGMAREVAVLRAAHAERVPVPEVVADDAGGGGPLGRPWMVVSHALDGELVHAGDPVEALGWLCVRAWRFGAEPRVGGFGTVDDLVAAYEAESGTKVDRDALAWWEVLGIGLQGADDPPLEAIRSGALDDRWDEVAAAVRGTVADKLAVANPGYDAPGGAV